MTHKIERIKKLIKNEILRIISQHELKDPRIPSIITITKITLSQDLHYCHIYFSFYGEQNNKNKAVIGLNSASGYLQKNIAERLKLKYTPKIEFRYDENEEKAYKVDQLLNNLSKQRMTPESKENN